MHFEYPLVLVEWEDIYSDGSIQGSKADILRSIKPCIRYTPGWLVDDGTEYVILVTDYDVKDGAPCLGAPQQFPKSVVKQIFKLTVSRRKV
jgi:hypothetical protein